MRVLVYTHTMELSGILNAVELAAAARDRGHEVIVLSKQGPLVDTVRKLGIEHVERIANVRRTPSPGATAQLIRLVRRRKVDIVHAWEWPSAVEAFVGPRLCLGTPMVCSIMSMAVPTFLPRTVPVTVGTQDLARQAEDARYSSVVLLEPPVDVTANSPDFDSSSFRVDFGLDSDAPLLAVVCRLAHELKLEGLQAACDAVGELAQAGSNVQLAIVGDGPARPEVEASAEAANKRAGRRAVVLTGQLADPRPAYGAADVMLGMGGSALRGMAFGKPLVVQGERGFWELLTPESEQVFLRQGWYGVGSAANGRVSGALKLRQILQTLLEDPATITRLGEFGRALVVKRYSINHAATIQEELYARTVDASNRPSSPQLAADVAHTGWGVLRHQGTRKLRRWSGRGVPTDDFNAVVGPRS
jgi:glycosyltransferase involved in cell wall biosynthesis